MEFVNKQDITQIKKALAEILNSLGIIKEDTNAEIVIGIKNGGVA